MKISQEVIDLINKGESINKIRKITGRAKSTIYYHYKKIKGKKYKEIKFNFKNNEELGEFLGIFSGDGSFNLGKNYHYKIKIHIGYYEKPYANYLKKKFIEWFDKKPQEYYTNYNGKKSKIELVYDSKQLYLFLRRYLSWTGKKAYTIKLKKLNIKDKEFNLGFVRGLIDTDGNYYAPKRRLSYATTSRELINQVFRIFKHNIKIDPKFYLYKKSKRSDLYTLSVHGVEAKKSIELVKPKNINKNYAIVV